MQVSTIVIIVLAILVVILFVGWSKCQSQDEMLNVVDELQKLKKTDNIPEIDNNTLKELIEQDRIVLVEENDSDKEELSFYYGNYYPWYPYGRRWPWRRYFRRRWHRPYRPGRWYRNYRNYYYGW